MLEKQSGSERRIRSNRLLCLPAAGFGAYIRDL